MVVVVVVVQPIRPVATAELAAGAAERMAVMVWQAPEDSAAAVVAQTRGWQGLVETAAEAAGREGLGLPHRVASAQFFSSGVRGIKMKEIPITTEEAAFSAYCKALMAIGASIPDARAYQ